MTLFQNPVFLTQKRLVHRAGVLMAGVVTAFIGLSLLAGFVYCVAEPRAVAFSSREDVGKLFFGWLIGVETLVLVAGGFSRISRVLAREREAGLWDSNRLTPLRPSQLVAGYWFGSALREFYMTCVLALVGLVIAILARLPFSLWLGTQTLLFGTAVFFGLPAVLAGMAFQRPQGGTALIPVCIVVQMFSLFQPRFMITNFLLPTYATACLFNPNGTWGKFPEFFGIPVHPLPYSLALQFVVGLFLWRAVVRKAAHPSQPPFRRRDGAALFGVLLAAQHGLIWGLWHGRFGSAPLSGDQSVLMPIVQGGTLAAGALVMASTRPHPARPSEEPLRAGSRRLRELLCPGAASSAFALTTVAALFLFAECALSFGAAWRAWLVATLNSLTLFTAFSLFLEFRRLRFQHRSQVFVTVGFCILCLLPLLVAPLFSGRSLCRLSLLCPGVLAVATPTAEGLNLLLLTAAVQAVIPVVIGIACWNRLKQSPGRNASRTLNKQAPT